MINAISRIAALALIVGLGSMAAQAAPQAPGEPAQQFTVLRTGHFVGGAESLTSATAICSITGTGAAATMECRRAGTTKTSYHFNTALVVDAKGTAYVIACRVPLVLVLCKKLDDNSVIEARMDSGLLGGHRRRQGSPLSDSRHGKHRPAAVKSDSTSQEPRASSL